MGDTISRQAAIDAVDEQISYCDKALASFDIAMKDEYAIKVERASLRAYRETLEQLPSAQPDLSGYSDRLWRIAYERGKRDAQHEIIRCRDCVLWFPLFRHSSIGWCAKWCANSMSADSYCSEGVKESEERPDKPNGGCVERRQDETD